MRMPMGNIDLRMFGKTTIKKMSENRPSHPPPHTPTKSDFALTKTQEIKLGEKVLSYFLCRVFCSVNRTLRAGLGLSKLHGYRLEEKNTMGDWIFGMGPETLCGRGDCAGEGWDKPLNS